MDKSKIIKNLNELLSYERENLLNLYLDKYFVESNLEKEYFETITALREIINFYETGETDINLIDLKYSLYDVLDDCEAKITNDSSCKEEEYIKTLEHVIEDINNL